MTHVQAGRSKARAGSREAALTRQDKIFYTVINLVMVLLILLVVIPIINVIANSFSDGNAVASGKVTLWPVDFSLQGYQTTFENKDIWLGYGNTIVYTVLGTVFNLALTLIAAWPLSRSDLPGRSPIMFFFAFTMLFNGGMIPTYLNVQQLGLINSRWCLIVLGGISVYNMIITRTFFQTTIPRDLIEAAELDGCSELRFFFTIVLPLSKAVIAVITLYYAVYHWNAYFEAFLYLTRKELYPLQLILRQILLENTITADTVLEADMAVNYNLVETMKYAVILVACVPIWCVYPFVQKYFVQGVMIGAIKG